MAVMDNNIFSSLIKFQKMSSIQKRSSDTSFTLFLLALFFTSILSSCDTGRSGSTDGSQFSIVDYGAVGDGKTINTASVQSAIDACTRAGGGTVVVPPGRFLTGTITLKNNVELHLMRGATLLGSPNHDDYPSLPHSEYRALRDSEGFNALVYALEVSGISITGPGTIDGQGSRHKISEDASDERDDRPIGILFISCRNVVVSDVHLQNSAFWMQHYLNCEDVVINNVRVINHANTNNDGMNIDGCRRVLISNCNIDTEDDCIVLKSTGAAMTEDVVITNCIVSSYTNAIKAGTETTGGFRNISISNCVVRPSRFTEHRIYEGPPNGLTGIALMIVDGGTMEGVSINNVVIDGPPAPIYIRLGNRARKHVEGAPEPPVGKIHNISISNIVAYGSIESWASSIEGMKGYPIRDVSFSNVQFFIKGGLKEGDFPVKVAEDDKGYPERDNPPMPGSAIFLRHVDGITIDNMVVGAEEEDVRAPIWVDDVKNLLISNTRLSGGVQREVFVKGVNLSGYKVDKPLGFKGKKPVRVTTE